MNFPGPDAQEARSTESTGEAIREHFHGTLVTSTAGVQYALGALEGAVRMGAGLSHDNVDNVCEPQIGQR